ncbi:MAG TPA: hypothetical protein VF680_15890 [Allosphingosinicella sp.]
MKIANVVSVRDIAPVEHPELNGTGKRKHIEALLRRYPDLRAAEQAEVVHFLATGPHLDVGLIMGNDAFRSKVEDIRKANPSHVRLKLHETLFFILAIGGPAAFLLAKYLLL